MSADRSSTRISLLQADLERTRTAFHSAVGALPESSWTKPSGNPPWTNGQLLFHIVLAFMLLPFLLPLARFFGRLPPSFSKAFALLLDLGSRLFNWVNRLGPLGAGSVYDRRRLLRRYDALHDYAVRALSHLDEAELQRGMYYPQRWDPRFRGFMTLDDVFRYPAVHMRHHLDQLVA